MPTGGSERRPWCGQQRTPPRGRTGSAVGNPDSHGPAHRKLRVQATTRPTRTPRPVCRPRSPSGLGWARANPAACEVCWPPWWSASAPKGTSSSTGQWWLHRKHKHVGLTPPPADPGQRAASRARDWRLYAQDPLGVELDQTVYAFDATTIDLCLSLFPWARLRTTKAASKLHTLLDLRGPIPTRMAISDGKQAEVCALDGLWLEPGAFYVLDRGYLDFQRRYRFVHAGAFFVARTKAGVRFNRLA